ncbi:MAG: formylglycine-generating enzyme family protein, partial [bacterium]|nr:formylglycine-generating enzyme family protein [bacterium]
DAKAFCEHYGYRLPTEAEWEFACRAGTKKPWSFGDNGDDLEQYAWYDNNAAGTVHTVGTREPNPWGLHDMHGNVWEWCQDWYGPYTAEPQIDPSGPLNGKYRVLRGGAFDDGAWDQRSADRFGNEPVFRNRFIGFRCVRGPRRQP